MLLFQDGIEIDDSAEAALLHDIPDIEQWVRDALKGKINKCSGRMISSWGPSLYGTPGVSVADRPGLIAQIVAHPEYRNRVQRDELEA